MPPLSRPPFLHSLMTIVSEVEERRKDLGQKGIFRQNEQGVTEYFCTPTRREDLDREDDITSKPVDTDYTGPIFLADITDEYKYEMRGRTTSGGGIIPFMLLARKKGTNQWKVPPAQMFHNLVNTLEKSTNGDQLLNAALSWTNLWGGVGLLGINSKNFAILQLLRAYINDISVDGYEFCTIPKEGVVLNRDLSAMLRGDISNISPEDFPALLYRRNPGPKGALSVLRCKKFTEHDKTKKGQSMKGWRLGWVKR